MCGRIPAPPCGAAVCGVRGCSALTGTPQEGEFADWLKDGQVLAK